VEIIAIRFESSWSLLEFDDLNPLERLKRDTTREKEEREREMI